MELLRRFGVRTRLRHWLGRTIRDLTKDVVRIDGGHPDQVSIAEHAVLNDAVLNVNGGTITVERFAFLGNGVSLLTGTHRPELVGLERMVNTPRSGRDIVIETGAWVASNVTILGPCRVGANAVVAAGSVVTRDVAAGAIVAGAPAKCIGWARPEYEQAP